MDVPTVKLDGREVCRRRNERGLSRGQLSDLTVRLAESALLIAQDVSEADSIATYVSSSRIRDIEQGHTWSGGQRVPTQVRFETWHTLSRALGCTRHDELLEESDRLRVAPKVSSRHPRRTAPDGTVPFQAPAKVRTTMVGLGAGFAEQLERLLGSKRPAKAEATSVVRSLYQLFPQEYAFTEWHSHPHLIVYAANAMKLIRDHQLSDATSGQLLYQGGRAAAAAGSNDSAERYLTKSKEILECNSRPDLASHALTELAKMHQAQRRYELALDECNAVLEIRKKQRMDDEWLALAYGDRATIELELDRFTDAHRSINNALMLWDRQVKAGDQREYSWGLLTLACVQKSLGRQGDAIATCERAISIKRAELGEEHPLMSYLYNKQAEIGLETKDVKKAERVAQRACLFWQNSYGEFHPFMAATKFTLAKVKQKLGRMQQAVDLLESAEHVEQNTNGIDGNRRLKKIQAALRDCKMNYTSGVSR